MNIKELLQDLSYPGRFLIIGQMKEEYVALYGVTGRNISSKAKRYVKSADKTYITVEATDLSIMSQGNLDLLQYNPVYFFDNGLVIGNGRQTDRIQNLGSASAAEQLQISLQAESYEDDKYKTPRITGCILKNESEITAALHIIRADENGDPKRDIFPLSFEPQKGQFISTYNGPNIRPTPSFVGSPRSIDIEASDLSSLVQEVYDALSPEQNEEDLRVAVVGIAFDKNLDNRKTSILNSVDV